MSTELCRVRAIAGAALLLSVSACAQVAGAANVAWVSPHAADDMPSGNAATAGYTMAPDVGYTDLLKSAGHSVTRFVIQADGGNDFSALNGFDLVVVARGNNSGNFQQAVETAAWNQTLTAPTIVMGGYLIRNVRLGYTTGGTIPDTTGPVKLQTSQPGHPIFSGIALDGTGTMVNDYTVGLVPIPHDPSVIHRGVSVNTDSLQAGGTVLAEINTPGDPADSGANGGMIIGFWDAGAALMPSDGGVRTNVLGGPRLVFLSGSREQNGANSDTAGMLDLTADGQQLLLNAVSFMSNLGGTPGDVDGDGDADINDFTIIRNNFQKTVTGRTFGDLTGDLKVNWLDFRQWKTAFGSAAIPVGEAIPEPATLVLGVAALGALVGCARAGRRRLA
jgi:hypothetical protein